MKIGMQTWGSRGDIQPFIALAEGLKSDGHEVTLAVTSVDGTDYREIAGRVGIRLVEAGSQKIMKEGKSTGWDEAIIAETNIVKQMQLILSSLFLPVEEEMYEAAEELCRANEILIGHFFHYPIQTAAEKYKRPYITVTLNPNIIPTVEIPPSGLPDLGRANAFLWKLSRRTLNREIKPFVDRLRQRTGLERAGDLVSDVWLSRELNLIAVSRQVCKARADWGQLHRVCGFFDAAGAGEEGGLPEGLIRFLESGPPPIYITFGSMVPEEIEVQRRLAQLWTEAVRLAGCRAIFQLSHWTECALPASENIHLVAAARHDLVFPGCAAVVHHGGAGTTQSVLRAGIPHIVVPHLSDQFFWGREMRRLGVGPDILPVTKLSGARLAERIRSVLASDTMELKAREIGIAIRQENGVEEAVRLIDEKYRQPCGGG